MKFNVFCRTCILTVVVENHNSQAIVHCQFCGGVNVLVTAIQWPYGWAGNSTEYPTTLVYG